MEKEKTMPPAVADAPGPRPAPARSPWRKWATALLVGLVCLAGLDRGRHPGCSKSPYDRFPRAGDPFRFLPCTNATLPPALEDADAHRSWAGLFDPDPEHWSWANATTDDDGPEDAQAGRAIYLCGYLDVPLDYTNQSDARIVRLAVTKLQVSGPARRRDPGGAAGRKSERTIVINPGGPGGSGTAMAWRSAATVTRRLSGGRYDVLGWDPRGVNASLPALACFPHDVDRDHWSLKAGEYREVSPSPRAQLEYADAMADAVFGACHALHGDLARFVSTAFVARDLERIRLALAEDGLTGYLVSYGTGIGQTFANMFPASVGRLILDGTEYVRDHRLLGGFGWTALDNVTGAWRDGFLGECVDAGPEHCALAKPVEVPGTEAGGSGGAGAGAGVGDGDGPRPRPNVTVSELQHRIHTLLSSLIQRPMPGYTKASGPSLVTYSALVQAIYGALYNARSWPALARMLAELEAGNSTLAAEMLERSAWGYDPTLPAPPGNRPSSDELGQLVICADSYDAPEPPDGIRWWDALWLNMTRTSWIAGNSRFSNVFPCRHFVDYWPRPAEVFRGDLNHTLRNPVLLIAETYDPATPLRNGRRLLAEMGRANARLVAHHGYGHSSRDASRCTDAIARAWVRDGVLPDALETACFADEKPYRYPDDVNKKPAAAGKPRDPVFTLWDHHLAHLALHNPSLLPRRRGGGRLQN